MPGDPNFFWASVHEMRERMQQHVKPGREARVVIHLRSGESFPPANVRREPPYLIFQTIDQDSEVRVVAVPENEIAKVDIAFAKSEEKSFGFEVAQTPDEIVPSD
jgi:hypothetical protein